MFFHRVDSGQGDAGKVLSIWRIVGGDSLVIGVVIFVILIIVQYMVINKGYERVAEEVPDSLWMQCPENRWPLMPI
jgi:flagellar biosynthesis component FlhA